LFPDTPKLREIAFEKHLWALLQSLHEADCAEWDPHASKDPKEAKFAMSVGGSAYFIVGLHPGSSRLARRAPMAAVAFNPHEQFRRLKKDGLYARLKEAIRDRDIHLQGKTNPMLAEHGDVSEAAQYSGREVLADWKCPFQPRHEMPR
jgi:FPC/CPF motif-containing protein YcgG